MPDYPTIEIHRAAPDKPEVGAPCNGCGVCCLVAPCPVSALLLKHRENACPALMWLDAESKYRCGMLIAPASNLRWLPGWLNRPFAFFVRRWLAIDIGCDCDVELH
jgi:hypothetical protein